MIRRTMAGLAVMALALTAGASAHEGHSHAKVHTMMGAVKAVHADMNHVELTTAKGTEGFYVDAKTKYVRGTVKLALADLKAGARVVVKARNEAGKMIANEVKVAGAPAASPK